MPNIITAAVWKMRSEGGWPPEALKAMNDAYAPYSDFKVGAALLAGSGRIYIGCNIENASYSATICAERVAFVKAVSDGEIGFSAIAIAGGKGGAVSEACPPCGICRQTMSEFCDPENFIIMLVKNNTGNKYDKCDKEDCTRRICTISADIYTLRELLPLGFTKSDLNGLITGFV